ncbi:transcription initiation factor TFIID subunit 15-like isoform X2 [Bidens hawaiensis]|uniref:transcription initiation factor TFIID subunit 15-like isoform X2 n=1 Tax=Bidens hawaiensis TaxID=980011 RepID=UPI004049AD8B
MGSKKKDKRTGKPKIWLYHDKVTNEPKGDATVTYEDPYAAQAAVEWFNNKEFHGNIIEVLMAQSKNSHNPVAPLVDSSLVNDVEPDESGARGRGRGDASGNIQPKAWQQDGDWTCLNTSCTNVNFAFRGVCNRCGSARPAGASGGGAGGRGRGRGGGPDSGGGRGGVSGPTGLFGPNDWSCPMCANINWAKRLKCNICNTNKPGVSEGGVRGGRAGGYKELDEEELEETKRRRREAEADDGEMYDEFGNLKKKFRVKAQQAEVGQVLPGTGRAGWEVEELGMSEGDRRERSRDRRDERESSKNRRRSRSRERERDRGRERERDRDYSYDRDREYGRERDRDHHRYHH